MEQYFSKYYNGFITTASGRVKPQFGVIMTFYPFNEGTVIKIELKKDAPHKFEKKSQSNTLCDALVNTSYISRDKCNTIFGKSVEKTLIVVTSPTVYFVIKSTNEEEWSSKKASDDLNQIITTVKERYGKK